MNRPESCLAFSLLLATGCGSQVQGGTFVPTGSMTVARAFHTATLLPNGKVLIVGGEESASQPLLASAELYDPAAGTFTATGSMAMERKNHTATLLSNGKVLIAGGESDPNTIFASAELYDPAAGTFTGTGSMSTARTNHTATLLGNGEVLIAGGWNGNPTEFPASAELYDPAAGTFVATGSMSVGRDMPTATLLPIGKVLIVGGYDRNGEPTAELYDPAGGAFTISGSMSLVRDFFTATLSGNGKVLITGGYDDSADSHSECLASAEQYAQANGTFAATGSMTVAREWHTATLLPNGKMLIAGGDDGVVTPQTGLNILTRAELFDPASGMFSSTGSMSMARESHTATLLPNGKVLIAGGLGLSSFLASADLYE